MNPHTPHPPRDAGGSDVPDRGEEFSEEGEPVGEVVAFPSRQRPVAHPEDRVDLPKRPDRKSRRTLAGPLGPECNSLDDEAEIFWKGYPDPVAWGDVQKEWAKARKVASFEVIMNGLDAFIRRTDNPRDRGFRPSPARWLEGKRWMDPERTGQRGVQTTSDMLNRLGMTGPDGCEPVDGRRKAPEISFEDLQGSGQR